MAQPTFTTGEVLTAADMNAVGLWRVTTCTVTSAGGTPATASNGVISVGTSNTSLSIANAFSTDFDSYRIVMSGIVANSSSPNLLFSLNGITGSVYYTAGTYVGWANTTLNVYSPAVTTSCLVTTVGTQNMGCTIDLHSPFLTREKYGWSHGADVSFGLGLALRIDSTTSATGFTLAPASGNITGGKIRVYGYRN